MTGSIGARWGAVVATALLGTVAGVAPADAHPHPTGTPAAYVVSRQPGFLPEGIAVDRSGQMVVGSDATGAMVRGDVGRADLAPWRAEGVTARGTTLGVTFGPGRTIWSVGADQLLVHTPAGRRLAVRTVAPGPLGDARLNDLVITDDAVYVTDFANPTVFRAERRGLWLGPLEPWLDVRPALPGFPAEYWLLNGIAADASGRTLLVSATGPETLWRVDVATRSMAPVDLGGRSFAPDGLELDGTRVYAVLNYGAPPGVYVADLDPTLLRGRVTHEILTDSRGEPFDSPTTLARQGCRIYVVNGQLDTPPGEPPYLVTVARDPVC